MPNHRPSPAPDPLLSPRSRRGGVGLMVLATATFVFEGYDIYVIGAAGPAIISSSGWAVGPQFIGLVSSAAVLGMLGGALVAGLLSDRLGRRLIYLATVVCFSIGMVVCALAPSPSALLVGRIVVGLGSGGFLPGALALVVEFAPPRRRNLYASGALAGMGLGGVLVGLLGIWLVPALGFRSLFWAGAVALVLVPVAWFALPESVAYLLAGDDVSRAREQVRKHHLPAELLTVEPAGADPGDRARSILDVARALLGREHRSATVVFGAATALCLLLIFGTNTWLPAIMIKAGYGISSALFFLVVLNVGAIAGQLIGAVIADRVGSRLVVMAGFAAASVGLGVLALQPTPWLVYVLVLLVGAGGAGTQALLNAYMSAYYPVEIRGSGLGFTLAVGRIGGIAGPIYGGLLLVSGAGSSGSFFAFCIPALLALVVVAFGPRSTQPRTPTTDAGSGGVAALAHAPSRG